MPRFSNKSKLLLSTCDSMLQDVCGEAIRIMDFTIISGHRSEKDQNKVFADGNSKVEWPDSKHNQYPSQAVDIAPYPIDWNDTARFYLLAGIIIDRAHLRGIPIRWGGDWDGDFNLKENKFADLGHFELRS